MLKEIHRVLKPSGAMLLSTPRKDFLNNLADLAWYCGHRHYSPEELFTLTEQAGFSGTAFEFQGGKYELLETWTHYFCKYIFGRDIPGRLRKYLSQKIAAEKVERRGISLFLKTKKSVRPE